MTFKQAVELVAKKVGNDTIARVAGNYKISKTIFTRAEADASPASIGTCHFHVEADVVRSPINGRFFCSICGSELSVNMESMND